MKYLFLILLCYGVKCKNVGNNYFVVQMPEDNIKELKKPFQVYWNVPTMQCASKRIPFQNLYEKYGIIQNDNDRFIGDKIVIIYNEIDFPAIIHNKTSGKDILRNGGVPQEGDLEKHLIAFENELKIKIPDPYFEGIGIIDFESWRPVFRQNFGSLIPHRHLSIEIEKKLHNWWPKMWIEREASLRFEAAARRFMQTTLSMVKEMRPNALWGYYGFPYCFNMRGRDMAEKCAKDTNTENDSIYWLWAESTALFPSVYSSVSLTSSQLSSLIKGRVKETSRVRGKDTPFFPYFWFKYRDDAEYITEKDLQVALNTLYESNASGFIIWGSSNDVNTIEKCTNLLHYVETVLGPNIAKYTKRIKRTHSESLQNKDIYLKETSKDIDSQSTQIFNTDEISTETSIEYTDESPHTLNNDKIFSTESYTYSDDSSDKMDVSLSLTESATEYMNTNQHIPALNIKISQTETNTDIHFTEKNSIILINDEKFTSSPETVTDDVYITDQSSQTSNENSNEETIEFSTIHDEFNRDLTTLNDEMSSLDSFSIKNEYMDTDKHTETLNNQEMSTTVIHSDIEEPIILNTLFSSSPKITADYSEFTERSSQILNNDEITATEMSTSNNIFNEETTIYNEYSVKDENVQILNINDLKSSTLNKYTNEEPTITMSSTDTSTAFSDFTSKNEKPLSTMEILSKGQHSTYVMVNEDQTTVSLKHVKYLKETSASDDITHTDKSIMNEIVTENSKFGETGEGFSDNMSVNSKETLPASDKVTYTDKTDIINEITENNKLVETGEDFSDNMSVNSKETSPASDKVTHTDKTDIINEIITENNKLGETGEDFSNNMSVNSSPGPDYLIIADNSANIETIKQYEHPDFDVDNDYIIIIKNLINKVTIENITDKETAETDKFETVTKSKINLDTIVNYEQFDYNINEVLSNEDESHQVLPDSNENDSDYLIIADNYTNIENNHLEHTDDDLIIVRDFNQENVNDITEKSTKERNLDFDDSDLVVAYIKKVGNVKLDTVNKN